MVFLTGPDRDPNPWGQCSGPASGGSPRGVSCCLTCRPQTLCLCLGSELPEHLPGPASHPSPAYPGHTAGRARESQARARVLQQGGQARPAPGCSPQTLAWTSAPQTLTCTPVTWGPALCDSCIGARGGGQRGSTVSRGPRTAAWLRKPLEGVWRRRRREGRPCGQMPRGQGRPCDHW